MRKIKYKILAEKNAGDFRIQLLEHNCFATADYYAVRKISDGNSSDIYFGTERWNAAEVYNATK